MKKKGAHSVLDELPLIVAFGPKMLMETQKLVQKQLNEFENELGIPDEAAFADLLVEYESVLKAALVKRGKTKPHIRKIRLSVFGFSRGAAEARACVNMITDRWGNLLCSIPLQIDFLGIFDTVASVGLAQAMPHFNGHAAWADEQFMPVPGNVKRCVHLVAGLEIRGSFPLDSVCQGGELPANCKEIVYPGVHSDVGGGYPPGDQGRGKADSQKLSQIALAQMYREARMAAVPLVPETAMRASQTEYFRIDSKLRQDFNAYVAATRTGTIPPTNGKGEARFASMYPTETQPREELFRIMRRHYGIWLRWRKSLLKQPGGVSALPNLAQATSDTRFQDIEDFKGAEQELRKELLFLQTSDPGKFDVLDDPLENYLKKINHYSLSTGAAGGIALGPAALALGSLAYLLSIVGSKGMQEAMHEKQQQWDSWLKHEWVNSPENLMPKEADVLFVDYLHDSRAWFKPLICSDGSLAPNDEDWFVYGARRKKKNENIKNIKESIEKHKKSGDKGALERDQKNLQLMQQDGQPLIQGGREPYRMWGYIRHRRIYQSGKIKDLNYFKRQSVIDKEEEARKQLQRRDEMIAQENRRHEKEIARIKSDNQRVLQENRISDEAQREYTRTSKMQIEDENRSHEQSLKEIEKLTATTN